MTVELTPTYIATVRPDRTITLPPEMPVGATVAVIVVPELASPSSRRPRDLYGIWRGRFPDDFDVDKALHSIRHEWEHEGSAEATP